MTLFFTGFTPIEDDIMKKDTYIYGSSFFKFTNFMNVSGVNFVKN